METNDILQEMKANFKQISFNVNDYVKVKPTQRGKEIIQADYEQICAIYEQICAISPDVNINNIYPIDKDGYLKIQLWCFMELFGPHFANGAPLLIEGNEILFEVEHDEQ